MNAVDLLIDGYLTTYNKAQIELATNRAETCIKCPNLSKVDLNCIRCSCNFKIKLFNKASKCPINKW